MQPSRIPNNTVKGIPVLFSFVKKYRCSLQLKLFFSLTAVVAASLVLTLAGQIYLVQDYFIQQAETNLRSSNYLLSRALADPLFERDLSLLQARLKIIHSRNPLCTMQLKDDSGNIIFKRGISSSRLDMEFNPNTIDGCHNSLIPVVHGDQPIGMLRFGVNTEDIASARNDLIQKSVMIAAFFFALFLLPFFIQIRRMMQPLSQLSESTLQFASGNLDYPTPKLTARTDELGQLAGNFQKMAAALLKNRDWQKANMAALNNEKSVLDTLLAALPVGVFFADHTHIRYCNAAFRKMCMFGSEEPLVGMKNDAILLRIGQVVSDAGVFLRAVTDILDTDTLAESRYVSLKDGRILRMTSNVVVTPENRRYLGRFWLFEDVTREK